MNRPLHLFLRFVAACTFLLLMAGALVTSNDAGLSVPDWPLSYGSLMPPMVGGILYEHGHRMIASFVGLLTIIAAVWIARVESRAWVRRLGWFALAAVVAQGVLGGLTVLFFLPAPVSIAHASLAQIFFCTVVSLALVTSRWWQSEQPVLDDSGSPQLRTLSRYAIGVVFLQLLLGAVFRHAKDAVNPHILIAPHVLNAFLVLGMSALISQATRARFAKIRALRLPAVIFAALAGTQIVLGLAAYITVILQKGAPQPMPVMVWATVFHLALGALVLASTVVLAIVAHRLLRPEAASAAVRSEERATA